MPVPKPTERALPGIRLVAQRLDALHIPYSDVRKSSLVCVGLGKVAVKYSQMKWYEKYPQFRFFATPKEKRDGKLDADLVLLVCDRGESVDYYLFNASDPVFYKKDGKLKAVFGYVVDAAPYDGTTALNRWRMAEAKNRWRSLEEKLQALMATLKQTA